MVRSYDIHYQTPDCRHCHSTWSLHGHVRLWRRWRGQHRIEQFVIIEQLFLKQLFQFQQFIIIEQFVQQLIQFKWYVS